MKIEKISDKQIRCTLTREDLANRNINAKELAYGSDKAKELFQDMMQIAAQDFGFEADNIPLVIEAIPVSMDTIILIITKVEDPEELDTRFAKFSPEDQDADNGLSYSDFKDHIEGADDILDLVKKISQAKKKAGKAAGTGSSAGSAEDGELTEDEEDLPNLTKAFTFTSLDNAICAARVVNSLYDGPNTLYKNPSDGSYFLLLKKAENSARHFNKTCNILSEYASSYKFSVGLEAYFDEHLDVIIPRHALQTLGEIAR